MKICVIHRREFSGNSCPECPVGVGSSQITKWKTAKQLTPKEIEGLLFSKSHLLNYPYKGIGSEEELILKCGTTEFQISLLSHLVEENGDVVLTIKIPISEYNDKDHEDDIDQIKIAGQLNENINQGRAIRTSQHRTTETIFEQSKKSDPIEELAKAAAEGTETENRFEDISSPPTEKDIIVQEVQQEYFADLSNKKSNK